jgi:hypothetical protein
MSGKANNYNTVETIDEWSSKTQKDSPNKDADDYVRLMKSDLNGHLAVIHRNSFKEDN